MAYISGFRSVSYGGKTYVPSGNLGSVSGPSEEAGVKSSGISISLSGVKPEIVSLILSESYMGRPVYVHYAVTDESFNVDTDLIFLGFKGTIDSVSGTMGASASFTISAKSRLADWERPRRLRYTDADQQKLYPGDKGMEYIAQLSQKKIIWPRAAFLPDPRD